MKLILALLISLPSLSHAGAAAGCKAELAVLTDPYSAVANLTEVDRNTLASRSVRYFEPLRRLHETLETARPDADLDAIIEKIKKTDLRSQVFRLDAGLRATAPAFAGGKYEKLINQALETGSALRYLTGVYTDTQDIKTDLERTRDFQKKAGRVIRLPKAFTEEAQRRVSKGKKKYEKYLVDARWVGKDPYAVRLLENAVTLLNALPEAKENKFFANGMRDYIAKTLRRKFDMDKLEEGVHSLRRHLRWMAITIQTLNIFEIYDPAQPPQNIPPGVFIPHPVAGFETVKLDPTAAQFSHLANRGVDQNPVYIHKYVYDDLTYMISELGKCKEIGQRVERYQDIFLKSGVAKNKKDAALKANKLASLHPLYFDYKKRALALYGELKSSGLLEELSDEVVKGFAAQP